MKRFLLVFSVFFLLLTSCRQANKPFTKSDNVYTFQVEGGVYSIAAINDQVIRVSYEDSITYGDRVYAPVLTGAIPMSTTISDSILTFSTAEVRVEVGFTPLELAFYDRETGLKLSEEQGYVRDGDTTSLRFWLAPEEAIYGAGERALPLNRRGYAFPVYNQPSYGYGMGAKALNYAIPHIYSSRDYMLLIDNPAKANLDIGKTEADVMDFSSLGGNMSYYFINGNSFNQLIDTYTELTGKQPLLPLWAFGHLQSRFGYRTRSQADSILSLALEAGYPVDAIILDIFWFGEEIEDGRMGQLDWDLDNWPNPEEMIQGWKEKGVKTITVSEPFFTKKSQHFEYLSENKLLALDAEGNTQTISDFYFGEAGLLDIFKPEAKEWIWRQYQKQKKIGVEGWWVDLAEPEKHPDSMYHVNGKATEVHGIYGHEWAKNLYDQYAEHYPNERLFKLGRAGYAGSQRFGLVPWSGDVARSWSGLQAQLPIMLGMGMSGLGYMHSDAGGFAMGDPIPELYARWLQYAVFTPIFRPHSGPDAPAEPVLWSDDIQNLVRPYVELRYQMLPYNYTLAWTAMTTGLPMARALFTQFDVSDSIMNQYMWGDALMVVPILNPGVTAKSVYLPEGRWYDFWTHQTYEGDQWIEVRVTMEHIPIFARAGHMVAKTPMVQSTDQYSTDTLDLTYYMGEKGFTSQVYFDDGKTKNAYNIGQYRLLTASVAVDGEGFQLSFSSAGDGYAGAPEQRTGIFTIAGLEKSPDSVNNGNEVNFEWDEERKVLSFEAVIDENSEITVTL